MTDWDSKLIGCLTRVFSTVFQQQMVEHKLTSALHSDDTLVNVDIRYIALLEYNIIFVPSDVRSRIAH